MRDSYPRPVPLTPYLTLWAVVSIKEPQRYATFIDKAGAGLCVTPRGYENWALLRSEFLRVMQQQAALIYRYEQDVGQHNARVKKERRKE